MVKKSISHFLSHITVSEFMLYVFIYGTALRMFFVLSSDFPLNDGGLFFTMVKDLRQSHFRLPHFTSYNNEGIPFAYPPLAFYLAAAATQFLPISLSNFLRFFPFLISIITIPAFYLVAKQLLIPRTALLATFVFVALPRGFEWLIMGGGLTRSLGFLFSLITIYWGIKLFSEPKNKYSCVASSVFLALTILAHFAWVAFTIYSLVAISLKFKTKLKQLLKLGVVTLISLLLSSFWWISIINKHGLEPFMSFFSASRTGFNLITIIFHPLLLSISRITDEPFLTPFAVLGLLGIILCVFTNRFWLLVWLGILIFAIPRDSPNLMVVPLALIVGITLAEMIIPKVKGKQSAFINWPNKAIFLLLVVYSIFSLGGLLYSNNSYSKALSQSQREAMNWIKNNTERVDKFLLITQTQGYYWGMDNTSEWFPALSERVSLATPQGTEWLGSQKFYRRVMFYSKLKDCYDKGLTCLEKVVQEEGVDFDFIYLEKVVQNSSDFDRTSLLKYQLFNSQKYIPIYENGGATIFAKKSN